MDLLRIPMGPVLVLCYYNEIHNTGFLKVEKVLASGSQFCRVASFLVF